MRRINTSILQLFTAFCVGTVWGTLLGLHGDVPMRLSRAEGSLSLVSLLWLPLMAFLLGTSVLGCWIVPLLVALRGYMLSAAFTFLLKSGMDLTSALALMALPAAFSVPALFLLCEEAVSASRILRLCSESGLTRRCEYIRPLRLLVTVLLLLTAAAVQIYLLPQIV